MRNTLLLNSLLNVVHNNAIKNCDHCPALIYIYIYIYIYYKKKTREREREVVCGQVWWPILGICPLHLTHPSAHSQQWTHTWSSGQPYCGTRGAVGGIGALLKGLTSVVVLKVERALVIHSPHRQSLPDLGIEPATFGLQVQLSNH